MKKDIYEQAMQVKAQGQPATLGPIRTENPAGSGVRLLFIGNSITLHGVRPEIGWNFDHGMAASAKEKDYVHRVADAFRATDPDAALCICNAADWERGYREGDKVLKSYTAAADFAADIVIIKVGANVGTEDFDAAEFERQFGSLIACFTAKKPAKVLLCSDFYRHPANAAVKQYAEKNGLPFCALDDLSEDETMKAGAAFRHPGIGCHPGDRGMAAIADRILEKLTVK